MTYLLGIDIGTTNVKTVVLEAESARVLAAADQEYPIAQPQPGYAEQNPDDWWDAVCHTARQALQESGVDPTAVKGIGLSGQMHGGVFLDAENRPLRPAIIWADTRSAPQVTDLMARADRATLAQYAPGLPAAGFLGPTLMWLAAHEPETLARTRVVLMPKDYVRLRLTGTIGTEASDAAATWLLDVAAADWSDWLVSYCGLERRYLPPVGQSADVAGGLLPEAAEALGLQAGIPVAAGAADMTAQALGYGLYEPGRALVIVGTGGQVFHSLTKPAVDPELRYYVFNHAVPGRWYAQAAILAAGLSLRWLRDLLGLRDREDAYDHLSALAADVPPGAEGLIFLPYLAGERTPHMDPAASGLLLGLRLHHGPGHVARAVMEGVTFALAECLDMVADPGTAVIASGGATKSPVWRAILSDTFERPLMLSHGAHHGCVGAALLGGIAAGLYADFADATGRLPQPEVAVTPDAAHAAFYRERRALFRGMYDKLRDDMHALAGR